MLSFGTVKAPRLYGIASILLLLFAVGQGRTSKSENRKGANRGQLTPLEGVPCRRSGRVFPPCGEQREPLACARQRCARSSRVEVNQ
ncbi:MAG: hypothetical protein DMG39_01625 [Acidobacteria bacterium]|nr:MAG: hypothetical protein DMG39_01625 [Acidobacteriota bacterium]